jgi:hypothetical protein
MVHSDIPWLNPPLFAGSDEETRDLFRLGLTLVGDVLIQLDAFGQD